MDRVKAEDLENALRNQDVGGWTIEKYINHGKSAAVFTATRGCETAAIKIFDDELIKRYGDEIQFARIERELTLVGKCHPNMVPILGGGFDEKTGSHYIVMKFLDGPNLAECLSEVPNENIATLIEQLASVTQFLEEQDPSLCHRDIKPENIVLTDDFKRLVLLDFGVMRPVGVTGLTDGDELRAFIGTLQYSSPEFLLRREEDSAEGWRALTFYQIGGVLHDLIMRKPLFSEFANPYAVLVNAIQFEQPRIQSSLVATHLVELAGKCLLKDWRIRVNLIDWCDFSMAATDRSTESAKQRVTNRSAFIQAQRAQVSGHSSSVPRDSEILTQTIEHIKISIRSIKNENSVFPRITISRVPSDGSHLRIRFAHLAELGVPCALQILMDVQILEALSSAVEITGRAFLGPGNPDPCDHGATSVYAGICNGPGIREALEAYLYSVLDIAQQSDTADACSRWIDPLAVVECP